MARFDNTVLFETSWEVCNKVGGIHTVLRTKAAHAVQEFGENYFLVGPLLPQNVEFEETDEACWRNLREPLAVKGFEFRFGRWAIPGRPKVILLKSDNHYDKDQILYRLWEQFGVDSIAGGWDYIEPVQFSTACGEVIHTLVKVLTRENKELRAVAQFHEWMTGAGLLYLKDKAPAIATVFTTHATVLGRSLMGNGRDLYGELDRISPVEEARNYNVIAKHSMEHVSAREADCFTTVSEITAREAHKILGRRPAITENGMDIESIPDYATDRQPAQASRQLLLDFGRRFLGLEFPEAHTRLMVISGRYEYANKGVDVFIEALARLRDRIPDGQRVLAYLFVLGGHLEHRPDRGLAGVSATPLICTHRLPNENNDPILISCLQRGLTNQPGSRVNIIFSPVYLCAGDGVFNTHYYDLLRGFDLGVFPSKYEPWGYTPHESAAFAVPTISTDLAGFGLWCKPHLSNIGQEGVSVLSRCDKDVNTVSEALAGQLQRAMAWSDGELQGQRAAARAIATLASWTNFFPNYLDAYDLALRTADKRAFRLAAIRTGTLGQVLPATTSMMPHFRSFVVETDLPQPLARLRELAGNLWWSWAAEATDLFVRIDPFLWESTHHNPMKLLDQVAAERLSELAGSEAYLRSYHAVLAEFDAYMKSETPHPALEKTDAISWSHPIAYFSTEFGIHESLPIYSGGLGILSGDHLKSASDLNIPLVGVGLYYKYGYFRQRIDGDGRQVAEYPENDFSSLPPRQLRDENGVPVTISVDLPGRTLNATIWKLGVGRISLYMLDSDLPSNTPQDRNITGQLYVGDERTRIEQEILLGIGGARMLRKLNLTPSAYHLNEGHSAFLIFENIRYAMKTQDMSFDEARELVKNQVIFTTHTPVEAGNERFPRDLIQHYFTNYLKETGLSLERFFELGRLDGGDHQPFIMTILALKCAFLSNGVSELHGRVSRQMWERVWNGMHRSMTPITSITNGVHTPTFIAPEIHKLLNTYLGVNWEADLLNEEKWRRLRNIPDNLLWETKCSLRQQLISFAREQVGEHWQPTPDNDLTREDAVSRLRGSTLTIGFARRFAPYKRAALLLSNLDRLEKILNNARRPVQVLFAGKAHPKDAMGADLIRQVVALTRDKRFAGRLVFIENYDLAIAKRLVRGVDVWLNTPRRPYEASGTSGEKAAINFTINLSVADGWWCEGATGDNGWTIGPESALVDEDSISDDHEDANSLYSLIEDTIVPLYYQRNAKGLPEGWITVMRRSMETIVPSFNTHRMLRDYFNQLYKPCAERNRLVSKDNGQIARTLADWRRRVAASFSSLHLLDIATEGLEDGALQVGRAFTLTIRLNIGEYATDEICADLVVGLGDPKCQIRNPQVIPMQMVEKPQARIAVFSATFTPTDKGSYAYGIRIMPYHKEMPHKEDIGLALWA